MRRLTLVLGLTMIVGVHNTMHSYNPPMVIKEDKGISKEVVFEIAVDYLKEHEGFRSKPYKCPADQYTIGYGHGLIGEWIDEISKEEAEHLLKEDLAKCVRYVSNDIGVSVDEAPEKVIALALFVFNVGTGNWYRSTLRKKVLLGEQINEEMKRWHYIKGVPSSHLLKRRNFEVNLYNNNISVNENIPTLCCR